MLFPKFNGSCLTGWLNDCEEFFYLDGTLPEFKVRLASLHLEGNALQWHHNYMKSQFGQYPLWHEYFIAMFTRFGRLYDDSLADLLSVKHASQPSEKYLDKSLFSVSPISSRKHDDLTLLRPLEVEISSDPNMSTSEPVYSEFIEPFLAKNVCENVSKTVCVVADKEWIEKDKQPDSKVSIQTAPDLLVKNLSQSADEVFLEYSDSFEGLNKHIFDKVLNSQVNCNLTSFDFSSWFLARKDNLAVVENLIARKLVLNCHDYFSIEGVWDNVYEKLIFYFHSKKPPDASIYLTSCEKVLTEDLKCFEMLMRKCPGRSCIEHIIDFALPAKPPDSDHTIYIFGESDKVHSIFSEAAEVLNLPSDGSVQMYLGELINVMADDWHSAFKNIQYFSSWPTDIIRYFLMESIFKVKYSAESGIWYFTEYHILVLPSIQQKHSRLQTTKDCADDRMIIHPFWIAPLSFMNTQYMPSVIMERNMTAAVIEFVLSSNLSSGLRHTYVIMLGFRNCSAVNVFVLVVVEFGNMLKLSNCAVCQQFSIASSAALPSKNIIRGLPVAFLAIPKSYVVIEFECIREIRSCSYICLNELKELKMLDFWCLDALASFFSGLMHYKLWVYWEVLTAALMFDTDSHINNACHVGMDASQNLKIARDNIHLMTPVHFFAANDTWFLFDHEDYLKHYTTGSVLHLVDHDFFGQHSNFLSIFNLLVVMIRNKSVKGIMSYDPGCTDCSKTYIMFKNSDQLCDGLSVALLQHSFHALDIHYWRGVKLSLLCSLKDMLSSHATLMEPESVCIPAEQNLEDDLFTIRISSAFQANLQRRKQFDNLYICENFDKARWILWQQYLKPQMASHIQCHIHLDWHSLLSSTSSLMSLSSKEIEINAMTFLKRFLMDGLAIMSFSYYSNIRRCLYWTRDKTRPHLAIFDLQPQVISDDFLMIVLHEEKVNKEFADSEINESFDVGNPIHVVSSTRSDVKLDQQLGKPIDEQWCILCYGEVFHVLFLMLLAIIGAGITLLSWISKDIKLAPNWLDKPPHVPPDIFKLAASSQNISTTTIVYNGILKISTENEVAKVLTNGEKVRCYITKNIILSLTRWQFDLTATHVIFGKYYQSNAFIAAAIISLLRVLLKIEADTMNEKKNKVDGFKVFSVIEDLVGLTAPKVCCGTQRICTHLELEFLSIFNSAECEGILCLMLIFSLPRPLESATL